ncbi:MAG: cell division protein FtsZ, partial [Chitinophagaceae bacterium]|nr:cell division protein FtsZ [Chitinophagaceae bacterium]
ETKEKESDPLAPTLIDEFEMMQAPVIDMSDLRDEEEGTPIHFELTPEKNEKISTAENLRGKTTGGKLSIAEENEKLNSSGKSESVPKPIKETDAELVFSIKNDSTSSTNPVSAASGGYLARPSNIYAESKAEENTSNTSAEKPVSSQKVVTEEEEESSELEMQLVERDDIPAEDMPLAHQTQPPLSTEVEEPAMQDETDEQKRRAAERLNKLRNLSFNVNAADPNNEFETVPAYIRRNMELYSNSSQVENFYSNYEVKKDQNNQTQISTINTFLDGKKPD